MDVEPVLKQSSIRCESQVKSKKHALDVLSHMLADAAEGPTADAVMTGLIGRERLGSTGLGKAIALPHTRLPGLKEKVAALLKLAEPVDFGAPDGQPVDLLLGLLVPEGPAAEQLREVDTLIGRLSDPELQRGLRTSSDPTVLYGLLTELLSQGPPESTHRS